MKSIHALVLRASGVLFLLPALHIPAISDAYGDEEPVVVPPPVVTPVITPAPVIVPVHVVGNMAGAVLNAGNVNMTEFRQNEEEHSTVNERKQDEVKVADLQQNEIAPKNPRN